MEGEGWKGKFFFRFVFMFCIYDSSHLLSLCFFLLFLVCCWFVFVLYALFFVNGFLEYLVFLLWFFFFCFNFSRLFLLDYKN